MKLTNAERAALAAHREKLVAAGRRVRRTACTSCGGAMVATTDGLDAPIWSCSNCGRSDVRRSLFVGERRMLKRERIAFLLEQLNTNSSELCAKRIRRELRTLSVKGGLRSKQATRYLVKGN